MSLNQESPSGENPPAFSRGEYVNAINKPFWRIGGDSMIGLCIIDRALRIIEQKNADVHCLWYPTKERIELTDRVWQSLKMQNWQLVDGEWRAIA